MPWRILVDPLSITVLNVMLRLIQIFLKRVGRLQGYASNETGSRVIGTKLDTEPRRYISDQLSASQFDSSRYYRPVLE